MNEKGGHGIENVTVKLTSRSVELETSRNRQGSVQDVIACWMKCCWWTCSLRDIPKILQKCLYDFSLPSWLCNSLTKMCKKTLKIELLRLNLQMFITVYCTQGKNLFSSHRDLSKALCKVHWTYMTSTGNHITNRQGCWIDTFLSLI